nr:PREDICTED: glutaredoxin-related protein 5, mitochondrial [Opisthocomus hoazin]
MLEMRLDGYGFPLALICMLNLVFWTFEALVVHAQNRIKNYSNWPTIPQVYLNGEFVGGCDILLQMHQNGDLVEELKKLGIRSALLDAKKDQDKK